MDSRKPLDGFASSVMVGLCIIWGVQQVAIKSAAADITPLLQVALRSGMAGLHARNSDGERRWTVAPVDSQKAPEKIALIPDYSEN